REQIGLFGSLGNTIGGFVRQLGADVLRFGTAFLSFDGIKSAIVGLGDVALKNQQIEATFAGLTGSTAAANEQLTFIRATADKLGLSYLDLAHDSQGLIAASQGTVLQGRVCRVCAPRHLDRGQRPTATYG